MKDQELAPDEEWATDEKGEYIYEDAKIRGQFDDRYIAYFCEHPDLGKKAALVSAGYKGNYAKQEAYRIHKRLLERIEKQLDDAILEGAHVGHSVMVKLCKESESDTVKVTAAKSLIDYAGRKAGERVTVTHEMSDEERDDEINRLEREIAVQEGTDRKLDS